MNFLGLTAAFIYLPCFVYLYFCISKSKHNIPLSDRTYTEPQRWMRGKGRVTIQFGCCYNYATVHTLVLSSDPISLNTAVVLI